MNYDLAIMALGRHGHAPLTIRIDSGTVSIEGDPASFKELARLCLLIGGGQTEDAFELQPGVHITREVADAASEESALVIGLYVTSSLRKLTRLRCVSSSISSRSRSETIQRDSRIDGWQMTASDECIFAARR